MRDGVIFYLQDVSGGLPLTTEHTLTTVVVGVRAEAGARAVILLYHRVADLSADPWGLAVAPRHFAEQLAVLREHGRVLGLRQLATALQDGTIPHRSVAVTFDDGYADNLHAAKLLLERHGIPATVFVTTGTLESEREFWWDDLERALLQPARLPTTLSLRIGGATHCWALGEGADVDVSADPAHRHWRAWDDSAPTARHRVYRSVYQLLYSLPEGERREAQDEILAWAGVPSVPARASHRALVRQELIDLAAGELIDVGAHGDTLAALGVRFGPAERDSAQQDSAGRNPGAPGDELCLSVRQTGGLHRRDGVHRTGVRVCVRLLEFCRHGQPWRRSISIAPDLYR